MDEVIQNNRSLNEAPYDEENKMDEKSIENVDYNSSRKSRDNEISI